MSLGLWFPDALPSDAFVAPLADAALAFGRLDQAGVCHPLSSALLYRARLDACRRHAAVDGQAIDPWHLAAVIEGLRLRIAPDLRIIERSLILGAAEYALAQHQWLSRPDFDQEGEIQQAEAVLMEGQGTPLIAAAHAAWLWLDQGGSRASLRAALTRFWWKRGLLASAMPLTGAAALRSEMPWRKDLWTVAFLEALAAEANVERERLRTLEQGWFAARRAVAGRRKNSRASKAVDLLAAAPLMSAPTLAKRLKMAPKNAAQLLEALRIEGVVVDVTHRAKRRLYGLFGLAPLRDSTTEPRRPVPGRGRGQPPLLPDVVEEQSSSPPVTPITPLERIQFDYSELDAAMEAAEQTIRDTRASLQSLLRNDQARTKL